MYNQIDGITFQQLVSDSYVVLGVATKLELKFQLSEHGSISRIDDSSRLEVKELFAHFLFGQLPICNNHFTTSIKLMRPNLVYLDYNQKRFLRF